MGESIELWGENFSRSKSGLNEDQVKAFINRIISEREVLLERDKQLREIVARAEKITLDAEKIANEIRGKAEESARVQAKLIIDEANAQAAKLIAQKEEEVRKEAESIKAEARASARKYLDEAEEKAQAHAKAIIMKAMVEGNELIEKKRNEAGVIARNETEIIKAHLLAAAKRRLKESMEEAEIQAQAQAEAILDLSNGKQL